MEHARLTARTAATQPSPPLPAGVTLRVPDGPAPAWLVVAFHGAGGRPAQAEALFGGVPGVAVLAPRSRAPTWDVIAGGWGPDVATVDQALLAAYAVLPDARVAFAGFSDGASYALSLGLANGDVAEAVIAFSPGFAAPPGLVGAPALHVAHGTRDAVLPVDRCSRRLVPVLRDQGYDVTYDEFDGPHTVPPEVVSRATAWLSRRGC